MKIDPDNIQPLEDYEAADFVDLAESLGVDACLLEAYDNRSSYVNASSCVPVYFSDHQEREFEHWSDNEPT